MGSEMCIRDSSVRVKDLLSMGGGVRFGAWEEEDVVRVVKYNNKQRFSLGLDREGFRTVRANQGHSGSMAARVKGESLLQEVRDYTELERKKEACAHGTFWDRWESIQREGLRTMGRMHVHFATNGSMVRHGCELLIFLDVQRAMAAGMRIFRCSNNVLLSRG